MEKLGKKQLIIELKEPVGELPDSLSEYDLDVSDGGKQLTYTFDTRGSRTGITSLLQGINDAGLSLQDLQTSQSSLEEIFVNLVHKDP